MEGDYGVLILFEILVATAVLIVLLIALHIFHRAGKLGRVRAGHVWLAVLILTFTLITGQVAWTEYNLNNFPLKQHDTVWDTDDGSIYLSVDAAGEQTMQILYEGEYRAARLDSYGHPYPNVVIMLDTPPDSPVLINSDSWRMAGSGKLIIRDGLRRIVLERCE